MNDHRLNFRRATLAEVSLIADLGRRTFAAAFGPDNTAQDMENYLEANFSEERIRDQLADPLATFLLAEQGELTIGYMMLYAGEPPEAVTGPRPIELVRFYVESERIGMGYGSQLMSVALEKARRGGFATIWLGVWQENPRAIRFYRKWGFQVVGTRKFLLGEDLQDDFIMARALDSD